MYATPSPSNPIIEYKVIFKNNITTIEANSVQKNRLESPFASIAYEQHQLGALNKIAKIANKIILSIPKNSFEYKTIIAILENTRKAQIKGAISRMQICIC